MRLCFLALMLIPATALAWREECEHDHEYHGYYDRPVVIIEREDTWGNLAEIEQRQQEAAARESAETSRNLIEWQRLRQERERNLWDSWPESKLR